MTAAGGGSTLRTSPFLFPRSSLRSGLDEGRRGQVSPENGPRGDAPFTLDWPPNVGSLGLFLHLHCPGVRRDGGH